MTRTRMRMKALQGAATLLVAMAETSTDWSSNVNPSLVLPVGVPQPAPVFWEPGGGPGPRWRCSARQGWREAGPVLKAGPSEGRRWRGSFWDTGPQPEGYTEAQMQR